ncbi:hypothetical protein Cfor_09826 [Coptotermes formosanus]|jgi:hypothetical protein|uniref:Transposase Helix-turn-helix domain-containing protein n=1 Tax=Coptotermes formosanus TaxID=36987 RepID=A0A6L2QB33_COPFO|nr:hypothetical protein Cfor_09826 [Coptotermes formosanus]
MTKSDFEILSQKIGPIIQRKDTKYREEIPASIRLAVTVKYLASGDSFTSLTYTFKISKQSISMIVPEVCEALIAALKEYVKVRRKFISTRT